MKAFIINLRFFKLSNVTKLFKTVSFLPALAQRVDTCMLNLRFLSMLIPNSFT